MRASRQNGSQPHFTTVISSTITNGSTDGVPGELTRIATNREKSLGSRYLFMLFRAFFKATSGLALPLVAIANAAFIELQNLPI